MDGLFCLRSNVQTKFWVLCFEICTRVRVQRFQTYKLSFCQSVHNIPAKLGETSCGGDILGKMVKIPRNLCVDLSELSCPTSGRPIRSSRRWTCGGEAWWGKGESWHTKWNAAVEWFDAFWNQKGMFEDFTAGSLEGALVRQDKRLISYYRRQVRNFQGGLKGEAVIAIVWFRDTKPV
jgi:hypothetical protein